MNQAEQTNEHRDLLMTQLNADGPKATDMIEDAHTKALHLHALLSSITGEGGRGFHLMDEGLQDNFLWACQRLAEEMTDLIEAANRKHLSERSEARHG